MKLLRKLCALFVSLCLVLACPVQAFAATWYLDNGDITIDTSTETQTVSQGSVSSEDAAPVITQKDSSVASGSTVAFTGGGEGSATLKDVNISADDKNAVHVDNGTKATLTIEGSNKVNSNDTASDDDNTKAAIHVSGELTIAGNSDDDKLTVTTTSTDYGNYAAAIGSNEGEDFDGTLTITGNVDVEASSDNDGAAIGAGSGYYDPGNYTNMGGNFTGTINITNGAYVDAESGDDGAGIGAGEDGNFTGTLNIIDAKVSAVSGGEAAGIGTGEDGDFTGTVNIINSEVYAEADDDSAGIGSEDDFTGTVYIKGSTVTAIGGDDTEGGAGIGSGDSDAFEGTISIEGSTVTATGTSGSAGIGAGKNAGFEGTVNIKDSTVTATGSEGGAGIGGGASDTDYGEYGDFTGEINIENSTVTATGSEGGAGIGGGAEGGDFGGTVNITDSTVDATGAGDASAIGGGSYDWSNLNYGNFTGKLNVKDSDIHATTEGIGTSVGTGYGGDFTGEISITGGSALYAKDSNDNILIGAASGDGDGEITLGTQVSIFDDYYGPDPLSKEWITEKAAGGLLTWLEEGGLTEEEIVYIQNMEEDPQADTFWLVILKKILAAKEGDEIKAAAAWRTEIPVYVLKAIEKQEVTLIVSWDGGEDIVITDDTDYDENARTIKLADLK